MDALLERTPTDAEFERLGRQVLRAERLLRGRIARLRAAVIAHTSSDHARGQGRFEWEETGRVERVDFSERTCEDA